MEGVEDLPVGWQFDLVHYWGNDLGNWEWTIPLRC
jgi:hypothetical protein